MADYQQLNDPMTGTISETIMRRADNAYIPNDPANRDFQAYAEWRMAGNTPDPPDALPKVVVQPSLEERIAAIEQRLAKLEK